MARPRSPSQAPGLAARKLALDALVAVRRRGRALDDALAEAPDANLDLRDRGFLRTLLTTALRRRGQIDDLIPRFLAKALPRSAGPAPEILILLATELLFLKVAPHAAVSSAVHLAAQDRNAQAFRGLINAVGRRLAAEGPALVAAQDAARLNTPDFLWTDWVATYGEATTRAIAEVHQGEAPLDIATKGPPEPWAEPLEATLLPMGVLRRWAGGRIETLPGFDEGAWWVQDAAAALPARLLGDVAGARVLDLCAAPGGKTLALAAAGAQVTAVDRSPQRLDRLRENLARTGLDARVVEANGETWEFLDPFPLVLLDAPCSSTGTIRRHPDVAWSKGAGDIAALTRLQDRLLQGALRNLAPGGTLVYATCSLQRAEGEARIEALIASGAPVTRAPIRPEEIGGLAEAINPQGDLRALPCHLAHLGGLDGFFAARLRKTA